MPFKEASMQHPTSCGQNILDTQVNGPYTASNEKQVLINKAFPALPEVAVKYIWRRRLLPPACDREKDCRLPRNWARQS